MTDDAKGAPAPGFQSLDEAINALIDCHEQLLNAALRATAVGFLDDALVLSRSAGELAQIITLLRASESSDD